jgi:hypothetical protein
VAKKKLDGTEIFRAPVDQGRFAPAHTVRAIGRWIEAGVLDPPAQDARVLTGANVAGLVDATREQEIATEASPCESKPRLLREPAP